MGTYSPSYKLDVVGDSRHHNIYSYNIYPSTSATYDIGSSTKLYNNVYATTFTGNLSGNATSATNADKLDGYITPVSSEKI